MNWRLKLKQFWFDWFLKVLISIDDVKVVSIVRQARSPVSQSPGGHRMADPLVVNLFKNMLNVGQKLWQSGTT